MQLQQTKTMAAGTWVVAMVAIGMATSPASPSGWTILALVTLIPPVVLWRLWSVPTQSLSEAIQQVLR